MDTETKRQIIAELSDKTLRSYRKKTKGDDDRWIGRAIAKAKMTGKVDPNARDETSVEIGSTEREARARRKAKKALRRVVRNFRSRRES